ncbi:MAG: MMPL family transporter [Gammaproteobacteria bacterium]
MIRQVRARARTLLWLGAALAAVWVIVARLELTVDLAWFLPEPSSAGERVLVDRLGQGPGSQLIFISLPIHGGQEPQGSSERLKTALSESGLFTQVITGAEQIDAASVPSVIRQNRYLLADIDVSEAGLRRALRARLADMAAFSDPAMLELIAADPYLVSVSVMESLAWPGLADEDAWVSADGNTAYLIARTRAPAFDIAAQQKAVDAVRAAAREVAGDDPGLHGVGVYGAALQSIIRAEAQYRSLLAALAVGLVLFVAWRRLSLLAIAALPLALGSLAGLAAVAALFGKVHGITLAFGFTLFGVAVDYPVHLLSHLRRGRAGLSAIWPTLRLGAFSTAIGYAAIAASGSRGLLQLGLFSVVGVTVTLFAAWSLVPDLAGRPVAGPEPEEPPRGYPPAFNHGIWIAGLLIGGWFLYSSQGRIWSDDLSSLTPLPEATLAQDRALRQALGAPDIRHLVAVHGADREDALKGSEQVATVLDEAKAAGLLDGYRIVSTLLPSRSAQKRRVRRLAAVDDLETRVRAATEGMPFRADAFQPFVAAVRSLSARTGWLDAAALEGTALEDLVTGSLYFDGERWVSLATLHGLGDAQRLESLLARDSPAATLIDLRAASESLVAGYRLRVFEVLGLALLGIALLLLRHVGFTSRLIWVSGTLASALVLTVALSMLALGSLSLFSLIATVLVAGLGLDYALFFSRTEHGSSELRATRHAIRVCGASTLAAFMVLALSSVPILRSIGVSVSVGVALCYVLARLGVRHRPA